MSAPPDELDELDDETVTELGPSQGTPPRSEPAVAHEEPSAAPAASEASSASRGKTRTRLALPVVLVDAFGAAL